MTEAVDRIIDCTHSPRTSRVAFVNADCLNQAYTQTDYKGVLSECDLVLPDGIGLILASRILGGSLLENVNGTDLFPRLCKRAAHEGTSLFLLGSRKSIAPADATNMQVMNPRLRVVGTHHGYFTEPEEDDLLDQIHSTAADILLLGMGAPRQELWVARNADRLSVPVAVGVGGLFDSCRIPRDRPGMAVATEPGALQAMAPLPRRQPTLSPSSLAPNQRAASGERTNDRKRLINTKVHDIDPEDSMTLDTQANHLPHRLG